MSFVLLPHLTAGHQEGSTSPRGKWQGQNFISAGQVTRLSAPLTVKISSCVAGFFASLTCQSVDGVLIILGPFDIARR